MVVSKSVRVSVCLVLASAALWGSACSSGSSPGVTTPTVTVRFEAGERASAKAVEGFVSAVGGAYGRATASQPAGLDAAGADRWGAASAAPASCDTLVLTYFNAQGQQQPAYDPATTTRIGAKGPCSTAYGPVTLDVTANDTQASSSTILVNGTAQGTYEGYAVQAVVTDVRMTKQFCGAPASGMLVATTTGLVATIRFDGSLNVKASYTWNGVGVSFTFALPPCQ